MSEKKLFDYTFSKKIGVPASLREALEHDAESFECFKKNSDEIALNKFLNDLIAGYYEQYSQELFQQEAEYRSILEGPIRKPSELEDVIAKLMKKGQPERSEHRKAEKSVQLTPTGKTKNDYLPQITDSLQGANLSNYLRNMFLSYSRKPGYERERIIFFEVKEKIENAIKNKNSIIIYRRDKPDKAYRMIPYKLIPGRDGQFNYLIGQVNSRAESYRLSRIKSIKTENGKKTLDEAVRKYLDQMIELGPQFSINEDVDTRVLFTEEGRKDFRRIYQGRPKVKKKDPPDENGSAVYLFQCSLDQLYLYFRRFNPGEAIILEPESLKKKLRDFHQDHLNAMDKQ